MTAVLQSPPKTDRMAALRMANEVRFARAQMKRAIFRGELSVTDVLADPLPCMATMKVRDLLGAQFRWGPARVRKVMVRCRIADGKTVGGMSARQRAELIVLCSEGRA